MVFHHSKEKMIMNDDIDKLNIDDTYYETFLTNKFRNRKPYTPVNYKLINAFIPGTIRDIFVKTGQEVSMGEKLLTLEAMKMKNIILSPKSGTIKTIHIRVGQRVAKNELLLEME